MASYGLLLNSGIVYTENFKQLLLSEIILCQLRHRIQSVTGLSSERQSATAMRSA